MALVWRRDNRKSAPCPARGLGVITEGGLKGSPAWQKPETRGNGAKDKAGLCSQCQAQQSRLVLGGAVPLQSMVSGLQMERPSLAGPGGCPVTCVPP